MNIEKLKEQIELIHGDCLEEMKKMPDNSVDSIVTDPPYGISFMAKKWDYDVPKVEVWVEALRVLKPGGHVLCACGTRTQHRMAVNLEDAGFEIRDMVAWVYGSGFPKSYNIGKNLDKYIKTGNASWNGTGDSTNGALGYSKLQHKQGYRPKDYSNKHQNKSDIVSEQAKKWEGWGTALKPAMELWTLCRKPLEEKTVASNVLKYGTGGINIDGTRIKPEYYLQGSDLSEIIGICQLNHLLSPVNSVEKKRFQEDTSNVIKTLFSVAENVGMNTLEKALGITLENTIKTDTLCSVETLKENINISLNTSGSGKSITEKSKRDLKYITSMVLKMITDWKISSLSAYQLIEVLLIRAKKQTNILDGQGRFPSNLIHDGSEEVISGFPNSKSTGSASRFFYCAKASKSEKGEGNNHPTVKPIKLMRYLVRLITPKGGIVLDPFMGSGSTGIACKQEGFDFIGIEIDKEYLKIAKARIK